MGAYRRAQPKLLPAKLLQIRQRLGVGQHRMAQRLNLDPKRFTARISEYEAGKREPNLLLVLAYTRAAHVPVEYLIDDDLDLDDAYD
jgi:transcriptional regulator with XRE-family HTH domain